MQKIILAVDDEPMNTKMLQFILASVPAYRVITVGSGREALEVMGRESVDLVYLDVNMPEMDGHETLRRIREISQVPVVFVTADEEEDHQDHGANGYLMKPFLADALKEMTERMLSGR